MVEIAWFESPCGHIIATVVVDTDGQFSGVMLARDRLERFRYIAMTAFHYTPEEAVADLHQTMERILPELDQHRDQGDESGQPVDFFVPLVAEDKLHPNFRRIATERGYAAAREIIGVMMRWHEDVDGNFVEQFQTSGFDTRTWELYLFAMLIESNLTVSHPRPAPDFLAQGLRGEFAMEATRVNPSVGPDGQPQKLPTPSTPEELKDYHKNYLPIRYAGPLTTKLGKKYWEREASTDKPLVFAIQDFHAPMSMIRSGHALAVYLYGLDHEAVRDKDGKLVIRPVEVTEHRWGTKTVQSGFFSLPDSQHVSAVLFNSAGTITKFNRMGTAIGFGAEDVVLIRRGTSWDPNPDSTEPIPFLHFVTEGYPESWAEGMDIFHNPNAIHPLDPELLPMAAHHRLTAGQQIETTSAADWKPIGSTTSIIELPASAQEAADATR
ncbi:hypothetical protein [Nocardia salmonicida]